MDLPLGLTLANAFLCHCEKLQLDNCPLEFKPVVYRRYVDVIFVLLSPQITCATFRWIYEQWPYKFQRWI